MITLSELQMKEVVLLETGERLGFIEDLEIEQENGYVTEIIVTTRTPGSALLFQKPEEIRISWEQITTIGADIILVSNVKQSEQMTK